MRTLLVASLLMLAAGAAAAVAPPGAGEEIVASHGWYEYVAQRFCGTSDPVLGVASTAITSRLTHSEASGMTTYTLDLDAVLTDAACPAVDFQFLSSMRWPTSDELAYGSIEAACGATGSVYIPAGGSGHPVQIGFTSAPASCGLPFEAPAVLFLHVQPIAEGGEACTPILVAGCSGARQGETYTGCPQMQDQFAIEVVGIALVQAGHQCDWWTGDEYAYAGDGFGFVTLRGEQDSCTLAVSDPLGLAPQGIECPAQLGRLIDDQDWSRVLP